MTRRLMAGLMTGALAVALAPAAASAEQVGGCPDTGGWSLQSVLLVVPDVDRGDFADDNGDGWSCARLSHAQDPDWLGGLFEIWTWMDNSEPL